MVGTHVPDEIRPAAKIIVIGEAPGKDETEANPPRPFHGASGNHAFAYWKNGWLPSIGLTREDCSILNVYPWRPANNNIATVPKAELEAAIEDLHRRLDQHYNAQVIVPMGNTALHALTGKAYLPWHTKRIGRSEKPGIEKLRGSVFKYVSESNHASWVVPVIHPAGVLRDMGLDRRCRKDWERIRDILAFGWEPPPEPDLRVAMEIDDIIAYRDKVLRDGRPLSIDIENPGGPICMIGFANHALEGFTVPTTSLRWGSLLPKVWELVKEICESPLPKIMQNGQYDEWWLWWERGIAVRNFIYDPADMHQCLDSRDDHDLAYLASVFTKREYWKDQAKDPTEQNRYTSDMDAFLAYNGKDATAQYELAIDVFEPMLKERGQWPFYQRYYQELMPCRHDLMWHGWRIDEAARVREKARLEAEALEHYDKLTELATYELGGKKKSISSSRLNKFLYEDLGLAKMYNRDKKKRTQVVTSDANALKKLARRYPSRPKVQETCQRVSLVRELRNEASVLDERLVGPDGRVHANYTFRQDGGRLASSKAPDGTGRNLQNPKRGESRRMYLADEGCILVDIDASQAESRLCFLYIASLLQHSQPQEAERLLWMARARPEEFDMHVDNAAYILEKSVEDLLAQEKAAIKRDRDLGKKVQHAAQRDEYGRQLANDMFQSTGVMHPTKYCDKLLSRYKERNHLHEYFAKVRADMLRDQVLVNSRGRVLRFDYELRFQLDPDGTVNQDVFRKGYSFHMQSDLNDHMHQHGWRAAWSWCQGREQCAVNGYLYDGVAASIPPALAYDYTQYMVASLERVQSYWGLDLRIPVEIKIGRDWCGDHEWKALPSREEFNETVCQILNTTI